MNAVGSAVVVGGASGIGAAVVARHRAAGTDVVVWDVAEGSDVICDVTDPDQIAAAADTTIALVGVPGMVTISAGISHSGLLADTPPGDWDRVMAVNTKGAWLTMRAVARPMAESGRGSIVAISSVSSHLVDRSMGLYCASKAALDMLVKVAASEWAPEVRVNAVAPGVTDTPMLGRARRDGSWLSGVARRTPLGRLGAPDDIAEAVLAVHLMNWVTGQIIDCDGGLALCSPINSFGASRPDRP
jgi:NAD(P)-dependent dehydrogenase (short-subunit alcohol dehydrogenase family)